MPKTLVLDMTPIAPQTGEGKTLIAELEQALARHGELWFSRSETTHNADRVPCTYVSHSDAGVRDWVLTHTRGNIANLPPQPEPAFNREAFIYARHVYATAANLKQHLSRFVRHLKSDTLTLVDPKEFFWYAQYEYMSALASHWHGWTPDLVREFFRYNSSPHLYLHPLARNPVAPTLAEALVERVRATSPAHDNSYQPIARLSTVLLPLAPHLSEETVGSVVDSLIAFAQTTLAQSYYRRLATRYLLEIITTLSNRLTDEHWTRLLNTGPLLEAIFTKPVPEKYHPRALKLEGSHTVTKAIEANPKLLETYPELLKRVGAPSHLLKLRAVLDPSYHSQIDARLTSTSKGLSALAKSGITPTVAASASTLARLLSSKSKANIQNRSTHIAAMKRLRTPKNP